MKNIFKKSENKKSSFHIFGLSEKITNALIEKGYENPTPIQEKVIPLILEKNDVLAAAQTGTGKTAGFTLPILELLQQNKKETNKKIKALILSPTRELASQINASIADYSKHLSISSFTVFGGVNINPQKTKLKKGVDILVATPGRLLDLYHQNYINFQHLEVVVLDEADRMLDMGFIHDVKKILSLLPKSRQTLLFSATFSNDILKLSTQFLKNPKEVSVTPKNSTVSSIKQSIYKVRKEQKSDLLCQLISKNNWYQVLIFTQTKHKANKLSKILEKNGISSSAIHGNKSQNARTKALEEFKSGKLQTLVATDIASRGLDINELPNVINYELPHVAEDYVHRIGRTGRAGAKGEAISLISPEETKQLSSIQRLIKKDLPCESLTEFKLSDREESIKQFRPKRNFKRNRRKPKDQ